jgi:hypothetical protein
VNWKLIVVGGLVFYITMFVVSFATAPIIHEGILESAYMAHDDFWRPELRSDTPDMAALMPMWITNGLISAFVMAAIFGFLRSSFSGAGWLKGVKFGIVVAIFSSLFYLGLYGVFALPATIWAWWAVDGFFYYLIGGAALGFVAEKVAPAA